MRKPERVPLLILIAATVCMLAAFHCAVIPRVLAHPVAQGEMDIQIHRGRIALHARITLEEVLVPNAMDKANASATLRDACRKHGEYLLKHLFMYADKQPLSGKLIKITEPPASGAQIDFVRYDFEFPLSSVDAAPREIALSQDVLNDFQYAPGNQWEAAYVVKIGMAGAAPRDGGLLTRVKPMAFSCEWPVPPPASTQRTDIVVYGVLILFAAGLFYLIATMKRGP